MTPFDRELASADVAGPWLGAFDDEVQNAPATRHFSPALDEVRITRTLRVV